MSDIENGLHLAKRLLLLNVFDDPSVQVEPAISSIDKALSTIPNLEALTARAEKAEAERDAMVSGLSAIVHCQSHLTRSQMREAAADLLLENGLKPKYLGGDQSPFMRRALEAEAERDALKSEVARLRDASTRYLDAVGALGKPSGYNHLTFFETPVLKAPDHIGEEVCKRWVELNNAGASLRAALTPVSDAGGSDE